MEASAFELEAALVGLELALALVLALALALALVDAAGSLVGNLILRSSDELALFALSLDMVGFGLEAGTFEK
jgi:hypothetical protein